MKSLEIKIVLLGPEGVGKTSIITSYSGQKINKTISPTIGASFFSCRMSLEDYRIKLQVWDTAGQERFRAMAPMYYRNSNAAIFCYDITCLISFETMKTWVKELKRNIEDTIVMCVVGNKLDLEKYRKVDRVEARMYAESIGALYHETSALTAEGIDEVFQNLSVSVIRMIQEKIINNMVAQEHTDTIRLNDNSNNNQNCENKHLSQNFSKSALCC